MCRRLTFLAVLLFVPSLCVAATAGPNSPSTTANNSTIGNAPWSSPGNGTASDNSYASQTLNGGDTSNYLTASGFTFSIPDGATIDGILVEIEQDRGTSGNCTGEAIENRIRIVKGGTIGTEEKATGVSLPTTDTYVSYGGSSDDWGESWTASDINDAEFGAVISVKNTELSPGDDCDVAIDHFRITIYYTESVPDLHEWAMIILVIGGIYFLYREGVLDGIINPAHDV